MSDEVIPAHKTRRSTGAPLAPDFGYVIYIRADIGTVWNALTDGAHTRRYWGHDNRSTWEVGAPWAHLRTDGSGRADVRGRVLAVDAPAGMVWSWAEDSEAGDATKCSRVAFDLVALGPDTKLTVRHSELEPGSEMDAGVREGWPAVLSNLKTLLETGEVLREEEWPR